MKRNKCFTFRIYPNESQKVMFEKTFGCVRWIYNRMLSDKIKYYEETKKMLKNTPAQYKKEYEWLKEVDSLALANAQLHLESAYKNFFRRPKIGFPKYKSKHKGKRRYTTNYVNGNIKLEDMGKRLIKIDRWYASSQICHICGYKNERVKNMSITRWQCPKRHHEHDRDYNASINIKKEGMRLTFQ